MCLSQTTCLSLRTEAWADHLLGLEDHEAPFAPAALSASAVNHPVSPPPRYAAPSPLVLCCCWLSLCPCAHCPHTLPSPVWPWPRGVGTSLCAGSKCGLCSILLLIFSSRVMGGIYGKWSQALFGSSIPFAGYGHLLCAGASWSSCAYLLDPALDVFLVAGDSCRGHLNHRSFWMEAVFSQLSGVGSVCGEGKP